MIVPMKKISLIILGADREKALKKLRRLGLLHIEITEGSGTEIPILQEKISLLESGIFTVTDKAKKKINGKEADLDEALSIAQHIAGLSEERKACRSELIAKKAELDRLKDWGALDPSLLEELKALGIKLNLYEMPAAGYKKLDTEAKTIVLTRTKASVKFAVADVGKSGVDEALERYKLQLPTASTAKLKQDADALEARIQSIGEELSSYKIYIPAMKNAIAELHKQIEFETYATGMDEEALSCNIGAAGTVAYFKGFIPTEDLEKLQAVAKENNWGLLAEDPTEEDDAPTKLKNNKLVSLIYPLTDFLGTVPGYFEYDISAWFLGFILIFFGIIFGDGGYGLIICAAAAALIIMSLVSKKPIPPTYLLVGLFGLATVLWGTLTCTWFGIAPESLPAWLRSISLPFISNVYADKIWYPFWTNGEAGLTTAQNVQIFCFTLALIQLSAAHIKCAVRHRKSLKLIGDLGSVLQLIGIFYVVLALVVNGDVFGLGLVIGGVPIGIVAIALVGVGFLMSFVFSNYEVSIIKSILASMKNIVSVLLGVVNVFSDIVSYIRLWAVGLAGAAISATVNELAGPMLGNLVFVIFAVIILVFGHGLNIILNVLSIIVHGIRLNTLEFSSHLDMSWSGHKYKPFEE